MKDQAPMSDHTFALFAAMAAGLVLIPRANDWMNGLWARHPLLAAALVTVIVGAASALIASALWNKAADARAVKALTAAVPGSVYLGLDPKGAAINLNPAYRCSHAQVLGSTNAGKSESVILPWAITDIENGNGILILDGKSDDSFLQKLYAYVCKAGRENDFRFFSLASIDPSHTFNPLAAGDPDEVCERVFASFPIDNPHYKAVQSAILHALLGLVHARKAVPTFSLLHRLLSDPQLLALWNSNNPDVLNREYIQNLLRLSQNDFMNQTSGLVANLSHFVHGKTAPLFNSENPSIQFEQVLEKNLICYFQLPTMLTPFLAEATGKLVLQSFQHAVSRRHLGLQSKAGFFCCYLDDFQDYLYPAFGTLLNKSRSANVGVVFSHQALGDLDKVGPHFKNLVVSSTNIKVIMRTIDPDTCDFYARAIGTETTEKVTERQTRTLLGTSKSGEGSAREVEKYIVHPKELRTLACGQGVVTLPHRNGVNTYKVSFQMRPNLPATPLPSVPKTAVDLAQIGLLPDQAPQLERKIAPKRPTT